MIRYEKLKSVLFYLLKQFLFATFLHFVANSQNAINLRKSLNHLILNPLKALIVGNKVLDKDFQAQKRTKAIM